jgi:adenylate cyclase
VLEGEAQGHFCWKPWVRRVSRAIPSDPRCKLCDTPFGSPGSVLRFLGFGRSPLNRRICSACIHALEKQPGGAEVEVALVFADVRGSTTLADELGNEAFSRLMARFYAAAAAAIDARDGIVDKFVGDELVAFFVPGFGGADFASDAVEAAVELLAAVREPDGTAWVDVGAAVHLGRAYVGTVGQEEALDFTALGNPVNTTARLAASAGPGEILVSHAAAAAAGLETAGLEHRVLEVRGQGDGVEAVVLDAQGAHMAPR